VKWSFFALGLYNPVPIYSKAYFNLNTSFLIGDGTTNRFLRKIERFLSMYPASTFPTLPSQKSDLSTPFVANQSFAIDYCVLNPEGQTNEGIKTKRNQIHIYINIIPTKFRGYNTCPSIPKDNIKFQWLE
jgi:hypothetical protein